MGHWQYLQIHDFRRADQLDLRLRDLWDHAVRIRLLEQACIVPNRLVCGVATDPNAIIHIIRTAKIPFIESRASSALIATTIAVCAFGIALPFTTAGAVLG